MLRLACSTLSCDGFGDSKFNKSLALLPEIGYQYIEFNCWHPADLTPRFVRNLKGRCSEAGLQPIAVYGSSFGGEDHHELSKDVTHKLRMIDAAVELGCRRVVATGAKRGSRGGLTGILTVLNEITPYAEEKGVLICLENHANNNLESIEDYEKLFQSIDSPNIGLCIDTGHFDASSISLDDVVAKLHSKVNHIHVKEAAQSGVERFVRFGEGTTNNHKVLEQMLSLGYQGYVSVELALSDKSRIIKDLRTPIEFFSKFETR